VSALVEPAAPRIAAAALPSREGPTGEPLPIVLCVDVEPDLRVVDPARPVDWLGFERSVEDLAAFRSRFENATGRPARFAWFLRMDTQIEEVYGAAEWVAIRYAPLVRAVEAAGDAIGLHVHPWLWDGRAGAWVVDYADWRWGARCVRTAFAAFARHFGRPCRAVRFGDRWLSDRLLALAERLGARVDLTAEPGRIHDRLPETVVGTSPDFSATPRRPYRPSRWRHQRPGRWFPRRLWMLPLGTGRLEWALRVLESRAVRPAEGTPSAADACEGWVDAVDADAVSGWVCDRRAPERVVEVEIRDGDRPIAVLPAGLYRPDLAEAGMGDGRHAFRFPIAHRLADGREHTLSVRVAGTDVALRGGPVTVAGRPGGAGGAGEWLNLDLERDAAVLCALAEALLTTHAAPCLALVVRTSAAVNPHTRGSVHQTLGWLARHPRAADFAFVTPADAVRMVDLRATLP
jgi:hypothetical protein